MRWRYWLALPLAAMILGKRVTPPKLLPPFPIEEIPGCDSTRIRHSYLDAYAYTEDGPETARKFIADAIRGLAQCRGNNTEELEKRVRALKERLSP